MAKNNKLLNDISKVASSTVATMVNIKNDLATYIKQQVKSVLKGMDLVSKQDFQALRKSVDTINNDVKSLKSDDSKTSKPAKKKDTKKKAAKKPALKTKTTAIKKAKTKAKAVKKKSTPKRKAKKSSVN
jgi:BMFP domain-containing protein YqiC